MENLKIGSDLIYYGVSIPVFFLDTHTKSHIAHTDTLTIKYEYLTAGEELYDGGYNVIVRVTDPSVGLKNRLAFAMSSDFDWNE
jgi:hypothetical protein